MPKKPPSPLRPQDAMTRFDRLLAAMALKAEGAPESQPPNRQPAVKAPPRRTAKRRYLPR